MKRRFGILMLLMLCGALALQLMLGTNRAALGAPEPTRARADTIVPAAYLPIAQNDRTAEAAPDPTPQQTPLPTPGPQPTPDLKSMPTFSHVFVILAENKEIDDIIGNLDAPYINSLAQQYGLAINSYGVTHPSLPNYIALTSGDTYSITSNCNSCYRNVPNITDQVESVGKTWKAYMETMPQPCFLGDFNDPVSKNTYRQKHDPFIYYDDIRLNPARCARVVPFSAFATDLQNNTLADYTWITPNMCNSQHDCTIATGDAWLKQWVPQILASPAWQQGGVLFITYDEGSTNLGCCAGSAGGRIPTLVISPLGKPAFQSNVAYDHYSLLRTIEDSWGLPPIGKATTAQPMRDFFP